MDKKHHDQQVQDMFSDIAPCYDLMNRVMTAGQDIFWRREVVRRVKLPGGGRVLDLGAGTGDLAFEVQENCPTSRVIAADFTLEMMRIGRSRPQNKTMDRGLLSWCALDAAKLPFPDDTFDAVISGFLLRNVSDLNESLGEQFRVLSPGGRIAALDTTPPAKTVLSPLVKIHLRCLIPAIGRLITGHPDAYRYLPHSTEFFLHPQQVSVRLQKAGFLDVGFHHLMFGTVAIYWGTKPGQSEG